MGRIAVRFRTPVTSARREGQRVSYVGKERLWRARGSAAARARLLTLSKLLPGPPCANPRSSSSSAVHERVFHVDSRRPRRRRRRSVHLGRSPSEAARAPRTVSETLARPRFRAPMLRARACR